MLISPILQTAITYVRPYGVYLPAALQFQRKQRLAIQFAGTVANFRLGVPYKSANGKSIASDPVILGIVGPMEFIWG